MTIPDASAAASRSLLVERLERAVETAGRGMRRDITDMVRPYNLTMSQCAVLVVLRDLGSTARISELGDATLTPASSMTHTIDRLERRGLIARAFDPNDRRAIQVQLTPEGEQIIREIEQSHREYFKERCAGFEDHELETLIRLFEHLTPNDQSHQ
jgi:DNA-binding MarR family transcriptional regulator